MQSLDLNLASRPFKNNTLLWAGYLTATVALVAFSVWNVFSWRENVEGLADLEGRVSNIETRMRELDRREMAAQRGIEGYDLKSLAIQTAKANQVIDWKAFSWTRLFNLMERIQPYDVRMTSIRPVFRAQRRLDQLGMVTDPSQQTVPVSVEGLAKNFRAVRDLQQALMADIHFGRVLPERLQKTDQNEYVFQLTFLYEPDAQAPEGEPAEGAAVAAAEPGTGADETGEEPPGDGGEPVEPEAAEGDPEPWPPVETVDAGGGSPVPDAEAPSGQAPAAVVADVPPVPASRQAPEGAGGEVEGASESAPTRTLGAGPGSEPPRRPSMRNRNPAQRRKQADGGGS